MPIRLLHLFSSTSLMDQEGHLWTLAADVVSCFYVKWNTCHPSLRKFFNSSCQVCNLRVEYFLSQMSHQACIYMNVSLLGAIWVHSSYTVIVTMTSDLPVTVSNFHKKILQYTYFWLQAAACTIHACLYIHWRSYCPLIVLLLTRHV